MAQAEYNGFSMFQYLTYMQSTSCRMLGWMKHKLESRLPGEISIISDVQWQPTPVLLPEKSHGQRSLVGCSPWVAKSWTRLSDFTFILHFHALEKEMATHSSILAWRIPGTGEPGVDRRTWWTPVHRVTNSQT